MSTNDIESDEPITEQETDRANDQDDQLALAARAELLEKENERLRDEYTRARQSQYRRTAAGLAIVGILASFAAALFPDSREVLFVLAAVGLFGGVLTYYLTPGTFVAADVGERIYAAMAANEAAIAEELGLDDDHVYLPSNDAADARLYLPQRSADELPTFDELEGAILTDPDHRGLALEPTGSPLFESFERALTGDLATAPAPLATQLADGIVEQFELAGGAEPDTDASAGRVTIAINDSSFGDISRFDHPIASFLAVGFVSGLERPIRLEVSTGDERSDWLVTCRWDVSDGETADTATVDADENDSSNEAA
ncbi:hypothetical protein [Natrinema versiforme]|uniref:DUF7982 domain-containing protein n=1 Tax=Natrinema versiforme JCM 10478 TaxID=1227496 RepID=L9XN17_9EURY|nr:hypothetical protein [Natrinema versiforme]ELY62806.1 hypothetical protein C489_21056 [Natrinema versiforme JCM 10478]